MKNLRGKMIKKEKLKKNQKRKGYEERLGKLGQEILVLSRNEIYLSMHFFETAFPMLSYELLRSTQSFGTDGEKLYYNPKYLLELYDKSSVTVNRAYLHVLLHCLFRHLFKKEFFEGKASKEDYTNWDLACDIAVESVMDSFDGMNCVLSNPSPYREKVYENLKSRLPVLTAEGIFRELKTMAAPSENYEALKKEFCADDHYFWRNKQETPENQKKREEKQKKLEASWEEASKKTQTAMETFYQQAGDQAGSLRAMLRIKNRHRENYAQFLRQFAVIKEELLLDMDSFDYIPYCFGLSGYGESQKQQVPLIEPLEYKERYGIDEFAIALDTSGSLSKSQIEKFLSQTVKILHSEETFFRKIHIHILACDAALQKKMVLKSKEDIAEYTDKIEISGFGGTDFRPVFSYLEQCLENGTFTKLRGLLYFTDGFGTYPEYVPSFETVFVLPADRLSEPKIPAWAMKISFDEDCQKNKV